MSKWNTSYIPSQIEGGGDIVVPSPTPNGFLSSWLHLGPLQAGAVVLISLLVLRPPFVMDKEDDYQSLSFFRLCIWVVLSIVLVWALPKVLHLVA